MSSAKNIERKDRKMNYFNVHVPTCSEVNYILNKWSVNFPLTLI